MLTVARIPGYSYLNETATRDEIMNLLHTSPNKISVISDCGRFGEFLFFSADEYVMTAGEYVTYRLELSEADIIEAWGLFHHEGSAALADIVAEVVELVGCTGGQAESLLDETASLYELDLDPCDIGELVYDIQRLTGEAGKALGFRAVQGEDEQGACYIVAMAGRENELTLH